ncbi:MAG: hypothetical protein H7Z37_09490 [Pyrinomonadaceae bacterium]|nr:hypothetical protein [Pyrinomonadaceae bacterium]
MTAFPLIIAHRGSSEVAPENTLAAFRRAIADGSDGIECDVRLSKDGVPIILHDSSLKRTAFKPDKVSDLTACELSKIDVGSWFNFRNPLQARNDYGRETIPSLEKLFDAMRDNDKLIYVELKCRNDNVQKLAHAVAELTKAFDLQDRVIVKSFEHIALAEVKSVCKSIRTAALFMPRPMRVLHPKRKLVKPALEIEADEISLHYALATHRVVRKAHEAGLKTVIWTADSSGWVKRALKIGVHAIVTNNPARLLAQRAEIHAKSQPKSKTAEHF